MSRDLVFSRMSVVRVQNEETWEEEEMVICIGHWRSSSLSKSVYYELIIKIWKYWRQLKIIT